VSTRMNRLSAPLRELSRRNSGYICIARMASLPRGISVRESLLSSVHSQPFVGGTVCEVEAWSNLQKAGVCILRNSFRMADGKSPHDCDDAKHSQLARNSNNIFMHATSSS